ncbi:MAG: cell division protein SepF [Mycobacteriaceae bacterium]
MSTLHKFKAYFGMVPMDDYEDEYLDGPEQPRAGARTFARRSIADSYGERADYREEFDVDYREEVGRPPAYASASRRSDFEDQAPRGTRLEPLHRGAGRGGAVPVTRGALAVDLRKNSMLDDGGPLSKISTLRPRDYSEARTIGERFRDGSPVIMDLVDMSNADAKRVVDFAAGLAFALRGSFDKVATKVFLLSPSDVDVSPEERRRIAETGFYSQ